MSLRDVPRSPLPILPDCGRDSFVAAGLAMFRARREGKGSSTSRVGGGLVGALGRLAALCSF